jgi:hypothetical protein
LSELETNQMQTQHEFHDDHKVAGRHLNQINHDVKDSIGIEGKVVKDDVLPPAHQHSADRPRQLGSEIEHKHTDTTHSAIGRNI